MAELNNSSTGQWSETDASNTSASPDGWPSGTYPNQVEPIGRSTMGAIKRFWDRINGTVTATGSANAYVYTPSNVSYPTAYVSGEVYTFKANFANTGAATLNVNSLGAKNLYKRGAAGVIALVGGEIQSGDVVSACYDGTQFQLLSQQAGLLGTNAALGTPVSGVLTNCTGTASGLTAGNVTTNANLTGDVTSVGNATTLVNNGYKSQNAPARALTTVYQNTTGKTMFVTVSVTANANQNMAVKTDSSATPTTVVTSVGVSNTTQASMSFAVLNNNYYEVVPAGAATLNYWTEWY
jgi:hypothetical protein